MRHPSSRCVLRIAAVAALLSWPCLAQIPRGHVVVSAFAYNGPSAGLWMFHSTGATAPVPITGLPPGLTGTGLTMPSGAGSVLVDDLTGRVVAGEHAGASQTLEVHVITLTGSAATGVLSYPVGTVSANGIGSTDQMAWLGNDILVLNRSGALAAGPLAGFSLGLVRPSFGPPGTPGTVVGLPLTTLLAGTVNAMAVHPLTGDAYVATFAGGTSNLYRIPLSPPHAPVLVANIPNIVLSLAFDADGLLIAGVGFVTAGANVLHAIQPATGAIVASSGSTWPQTPSPFLSVNGVTCDRANGDLLFVEDLQRTAFRCSRLGGGAYAAPTPVATALTDAPSGVAYRTPVTTYGLHSPATFAYGWQTTLLPGGNPTLGNAGFQLALLPNASTSLTVLGASVGAPTPAPVLTPLGFTLLLHVATAFPVASYASPPAALPLPIPAMPGLAGQDFFFQTFHLDPAGIAASNGLWLTPF